MKDHQDVTGCEAANLSQLSRTDLRCRILLVEDDLSIRELSAEMLTHSGYAVDMAADGAAGLEALLARHFDLIITDHKMPGMTGIEMIEKLRSVREAPPVIMTTGELPMEELARHPLLQPSASLLKPYTMEELLGKVKEILRGADGARRQAAPLPDRLVAPATESPQP